MSNGTPKRIIGPTQLAAAAATLYTAPSYIPNTMVTVVRKLAFFNADTVARLVTISIGADAAGTRILDQFSIPAGQPYAYPGVPITIVQAGTIQGFCDVASKVVVTADALENVGP